MQDIYNKIDRIKEEMNNIIIGKAQFIDYLLVGFFAGGHVLIEDVPGLGKTTTAKALGHTISGAKISRIQCTPDLLPYDITGVEFYDAKNQSFRFEQGPIFADIILADELNRANPRTQSALLEAMAERQVTITNQTHQLSDIFFVIATQNPVDADASYPLPIAELDRFLFKLTMGYPSLEDEKVLLEIALTKSYLEKEVQSMDIAEIRIIKQAVHTIECSDGILQLVAKIMHDCRKHQEILLGPSPRAAIQLIHAAKALALLKHRSFVIDEDIKEILLIALPHRMKAQYAQSDLNKIILDIYTANWHEILRR